MAEITINGVTGTTLLEYEDQFRDAYLDIDSEWNITPESPDGQVIGIWSEALANLDEQVQFAYMARDPATATGQALDDIGDYAGLTRQDATFSTATVILSGTNGTLVPEGSRVRNSDTGTTWSLDADTTISGATSANVTATEAGALTAAIGTLAEIADPVAGWESVTNDDSAAIGSDEESDNAFRLRRNQSVALPGSNQVDNIFAVVANVDGVTQAIVYENPEDIADANGLGPHSIAIFAQGGDQSEIIDAIATRKNPGCGMNAGSGFPNTITENTVTPLGNPLTITFFRPELVSIFVEVTIDTDTLSESEKADIKQAIVDYSLEGFPPGTGFSKRGFQIGERISAGRLYTPVNDIVADKGGVDSITVGTSPSPTGQSVAIDFDQLAVFDVNNITVDYV